MFKIVTTEAEKQDAFDIRKQVFVEEQGVPLENELDDYDAFATHIIGYDDKQQPFATARFRQYDQGVKIERVAILPTYRKSGYGKKLMQFIETSAAQQGYTKLILNAQLHAKLFYSSLGYNSVGDIFYEEEIKHVKMVKSI
ncbi:GNAT family N-acetyltransferase [Staphylococcus arlettae]|uniref:GNAT family N-acetyltransferase n=1 Tax=Staphylococcus arlettae TaxID=29378 RepID=UPI000D1BE737|nr:GNAT family N-acetyltransferase [Staphylococcus arlettae]MBF0738857.1 GNAT family N-acetyltransferase [Staphylococcus arlettae]MBK3720472.1 putative N-acetyltransferase YjcF [Staphylococcus arlettae]PTH21960.1 GNAT family N-acetyltransferase [Staphylococcus arlettae]PTH24686.1 GNAT family N-acetyltransferase [Staphylococcus arlettae]PTH31147.1 GNAT family N-acetyltransferase [Staphylococcus arlettae]